MVYDCWVVRLCSCNACKGKCVVISVVVVEDEPLWQSAIELLLSAEPDMTVVAQADCAEDALKLIESHTPDVVLLDWKIKGPVDGLELATHLLAQYSPESLILISGSPAEIIPENPFAYVSKPNIASKLIPTIRHAMQASKTAID